MRRLPLLVHILNLDLVFLAGCLYPLLEGPATTSIILTLLVAVNGVARLAGQKVRAVSDAVFRSRVGRDALFVASSVIVTLGGIEALAHGLHKLGLVEHYSAMRTMSPEGIEDWRMAHITADKHREPDPVLLWRPVDRSPYTSQRFKGPEISAVKTPDTFRIVAYGDSNTDGPDRGSWPEQLQEILDRKVADGRRYEVLNAGVAGYSSYQGLMRFRRDAGRYDFDLVLVSFGWNDLASALGAPDKTFRPPSRLVAALQRILLRYRAVLVALYYLGPSPPLSSEIVEHRVSLEDYVANLQGFAEVARQYGASVALLTRPHRAKRAVLEAVRENWRREVPRYNARLLELGDATDILVIDVQQAFEARYGDLFADGSHFTREGHRRMGELIYEALIEAHLLPVLPAE